MKSKIVCIIAVFAAALLITATNGYSFGSYGNTVNTLCSPVTPYTGDCALCHTSSRSAPTPAKDAYLAGGTTLTDYFCPTEPPPPVCTDNDGDAFAVEGGDCGPVDCNDNNAAINPDAFDIPNNGIDENCDGTDSVDTSILDMDGDGFTPATGDCNDNDNTIYPNAPEICEDGIDNDCDNLIDEDCNPACPDADGDGYQDIVCGGSDCNDDDANINPGAFEICDSIDNNCNGQVDEIASCKGNVLLQMLPVIINSGRAPVVGAPPVGTPAPQPSPPPADGPVITASVNGGGSIEPSGTVTVARGTNALFIMTPKAGYKMDDLVIDGASIIIRDRYLFLSVTENHSIKAIFLPTITASASQGGYIWPDGSRTVGEVERLTGMIYQFTPMAGYHVNDVLVNGSSVGAVASYTFPGNITVPQTISVTFARN